MRAADRDGAARGQLVEGQLDEDVAPAVEPERAELDHWGGGAHGT
jgi:hypothetical protein